MRTLFLATWYPYPPDNGSKLRAYHLLRALGSRHQVTLLSFAFDTARPEKTSALDTFCRDVQVITGNPFEINRAGALATFLSTHPPVTRSIPAMQQLVTAAWQRGESYDAVIASTEMTADYALTAPPGVTKILEEHNSLTRWMAERYRGQHTPLQRARCWVSWQKRRWYERRLYPHFDLVTMVSRQDAQVTTELVRGEKPRIALVPNGVDCAHNRPSLAQPRASALVFNGSLTYSANYDAMRWFLAEVYPTIRAQVPGVTLTITGSTQGVDLTGLALDDSVTLTGFVEDVRIPVVGASVAIAPIRQGGGTRLKILEAMALGTPVVTTSKGAEGLDVADGEHLILVDEPETFARCTVELLGNSDLRQSLVTNARRLVEEHYDWQAIGTRFVGLVEAAVEARVR